MTQLLSNGVAFKQDDNCILDNTDINNDKASLYKTSKYTKRFMKKFLLHVLIL